MLGKEGSPGMGEPFLNLCGRERVSGRGVVGCQLNTILCSDNRAQFV